MRTRPAILMAALSTSAAMAAAALLAAGCGSALTPPPGYFASDASQADREAQPQPDATTQGDNGDAQAPPECVADADCADKFALYPCQRAVCGKDGQCAVEQEADGTPCDDGDACTLDDQCSDGLCVPHGQETCDDDDPCTDDTCDPHSGCEHTPNTAPCNDGEVCTVGDVCTQGVCVGTPTSECWSGPCCEAHDAPGCDDTAIAQCVCAQAPGCCALGNAWTQDCVDLIATAQCGACTAPTCPDGTCQPSEDCASCPSDCGFCPGCGDGTCGPEEDCLSCAVDCGSCGQGVCGDGVCSDGESCQSCEADCGACSGATCGDGTCDLSESCQSCEADCGACPAGCGDGVCTSDEGCETCPLDCGVCVGDCCEQHDAPGCSEPLIQACVCAADEYCCHAPWDGVCVAQVTTVGCAACNAVICGDGVCTPDKEDCASCEADCGVCPFCGDGSCDDNESCQTCADDCGECPVGGACCETSTTPGCSDPSVESCVCAIDSLCCTSSWDSWCVNEVDQYGCGSCGGSNGCGDGFCDWFSEDEYTCPEDCGGGGGYCGDYYCDWPNEDEYNCYEDCGWW